MTAAAADRRPVVDFIVRVSRVGYRSATLDSDKEQLRQLHAWAGMAGYDVGQVHLEIDVSGKTTDRKALKEAKARVIDGQADAIAAAYVSRFSRNTVEGLELVQDVLAAGRQFIPLDLLGMDLRSPAGEQFLTMKLAEARAEWRVRQDTFNHYRGKAIKDGKHLTELFGYRKGSDGVLVPDPLEAPWVPRIFERRAAGMSWPALAEWLNSEGVRPHAWSDRKDGQPSARKRGKKWTHARVSTIVECRTYLGEARSGDDNVNPNAHRRLVSDALFAKCEALRDLRPRRGREEYELSGVLRCATCDGTMGGTTDTKNGKAYRYYACRTKTCTRKVRAEKAERYTHAKLGVVVDGMTVEASEKTDNLDAALAHLADMEGVVAEAGADLELKKLSRPAYLAAIAEAEGRVTSARAAVRKTRASVTGVSATPDDVDGWAALPVDVRRRFVAEAFEAVYVSPDRTGFAVVGRGELTDTDTVAALLAAGRV